MVAGLPLLNGSPILEGYISEVDATIVTRLLDAGATLCGKAHCENLCLSGSSFTNTRGPVHNPLRRGHSAAWIVLGVGGGGRRGRRRARDRRRSGRVDPRARGAMRRGRHEAHLGPRAVHGIGPLDPSLDHAGPITANVRDNARMLAAMAGPDGIDMRQSGVPAGDYLGALEGGVDGLRVAVVAEGFTAPGMQAPVAQTVRAAAERFAKLGARVEEIRIPEHARANMRSPGPLLFQGVYRTVLCEGGQGNGRPDVYLPGFYDRMSRWREHASAFPAAPEAARALRRVAGAAGRQPLLRARRQPGAADPRGVRPRAFATPTCCSCRRHRSSHRRFPARRRRSPSSSCAPPRTTPNTMQFRRRPTIPRSACRAARWTVCRWA
jgi:amidase